MMATVAICDLRFYAIYNFMNLRFYDSPHGKIYDFFTNLRPLTHQKKYEILVISMWRTKIDHLTRTVKFRPSVQITTSSCNDSSIHIHKNFEISSHIDASGEAL